MKTFEAWNIKNIFNNKKTPSTPPPINPEDPIDPYGEEIQIEKKHIYSTAYIDFFNEKIQAKEYILYEGKGVSHINRSFLNVKTDFGLIFKITSFISEEIIAHEDHTQVIYEQYPQSFTIYVPIKNEEARLRIDPALLKAKWAKFRASYLEYETIFNNIRKKEG